LKKGVHISAQQVLAEAPRQPLYLTNHCVFFDAAKKAAFVSASDVWSSSKQALKKRWGATAQLNSQNHHEFLFTLGSPAASAYRRRPCQ